MKKTMMLIFGLLLIVGSIFAAEKNTIVKESPASDFEYDLNETEDGVVITGYRGKGGDVIIPAEIEGYPVVECNGTFDGGYVSITSIIFPDSITKISNPGLGVGYYHDENEAVFKEMRSLKKVIFPKHLKEIPAYMLYDCYNITTIQLPADVEIIGRWAFENLAISDIYLPNTVQKIEDYAFSRCRNLKIVTLPSSLKEIAGSVFSECNNIETLNLSDGIESIDSKAFENTAIRTLTIPSSVKKIGESSFANCKNLETLTLSDGIEEIESYAFRGTAIKKLVIPPSVKRIGQCAFKECKQLESLALSDGIETIGAYAFSETAIKMLTIPVSVKRIEAGAFSGGTWSDTKLETLIISDGIEFIGRRAFSKSPNLTSVTLPEKQIKYGNKEYSDYADCFSNCPQIPLKDRKKIRDTGYTGGFNDDK
ncbi:leucine-rich repeat domain-containing protein [Treponema sp. OMZ 906]|uniref:leucine-rich repeat domain-containing protein n=1 Tax=Treponema sp. OMZ 906 TaxID=2563662 RepID=UPI0020A48650|nr:leucine-rich repeat domain-containing protein [Treponema sp. OMZ 906]UTC54535.1 leucine-rich repeat domain-containing protein [Treponema sp. OMZ 906]